MAANKYQEAVAAEVAAGKEEAEVISKIEANSEAVGEVEEVVDEAVEADSTIDKMAKCGHQETGSSISMKTLLIAEFSKIILCSTKESLRLRSQA